MIETVSNWSVFINHAIFAAGLIVWSLFVGLRVRRLPTIGRYEAFFLYICLSEPPALFAWFLGAVTSLSLLLPLLIWPFAVWLATRNLRIGVLEEPGYIRLLQRHNGRIKKISTIADLSGIDVLIASKPELKSLGGQSHKRGELVEAVVRNGIDVRLPEDYLEHYFGSSNVGRSAANVTAEQSRVRLYDFGKVVLEKLLVLVLLVVTAPISLVVFLSVLLIDGRPILYKQKRLGKGGRQFSIYKFRTMVTDADGNEYATALGNYLRYLHLDELPQLFNILRGDMAFVGPRPEWVLLSDEKAAPADYWLRLAVKPGLTGWAQVNYRPTRTKRMRRRKLGYDVYYINNRTVFLDGLIWLRTVNMLFLALIGRAKGRSLR